MIALAQLLIQMGTADYEVIEYYPKGFYIRPVDHVLTVDPSLIGTMLDRAISAATTMSFVYSLFADATTYTLSSQGAVSETSALLGLSGAIVGGGPYTYEASTAPTPIGIGDMRFDSLDLSTATVCWVSDQDGDAVNQETYLGNLHGDIVHILSAEGNGIIFQCLNPTDEGGHHELTIYEPLVVGAPLTDLDTVYFTASLGAGGHLSGVK